MTQTVILLFLTIKFLTAESNSFRALRLKPNKKNEGVASQRLHFFCLVR